MFIDFRGIFRLVKTDVNTGETTYDSGWKENVVPDHFIRTITSTNTHSQQPSSPPDSTGRIFGPFIVISEYDRPESQFLQILPDCYEIGTVPSGVTSPSGILGSFTFADPAYVQYQNVFSPPASTTRNINTIGITDATGLSGGACEVQAYTQLATTCTQTTSEILTVFYRVQFLLKEGSRMWPARLEPFVTRHTQFGSSVFPEGIAGQKSTTQSGLAILSALVPPSAEPTTIENNGPTPLWSGGTPSGSFSGSPVSYRSGSQGSDPRNFARTFNYSRGLTDSLGAIFGGIYIGNSTEFDDDLGRPPGYYNKILPEGETKLQNIFSHNSTTIAPFFDPGNIPTTTGAIIVDADGWTNPDYPQNWRIDITTSGVVGVAEYKLKVRRTFGYVNNTYDPRFTFYPHICGGPGTWAPAKEWWDNRDVAVQGPSSATVGLPWHVYNNRNVIAVDADALIIFDTLTLERTIFDSTNFPAFTPSAIGQVEIDEISDTIWVGCRNTGIYSIQDPLGTPTVTFHDITGASGGLTLTNQCYGVDVGADITGQRRVWAVVEGGLVESNDGGTTWAAYDSTTTGTKTFTNGNIEADWSSVFFIKADPNPTNNELGIMYEAAASDMRVVWWDEISDAQDLFSGNVYPFGLTADDINARRFHMSFDVSNTDSVWAIASGSTLNTSTANRAKVLTYGQGDAGIVSIETPNGVPSSNSDTNNTTCRSVMFTKDNTGADALLIVTNPGGGFVTAYVGRTSGSFSEVLNAQSFNFQTNFGAAYDSERSIANNAKAYLGNGVIVGVWTGSGSVTQGPARASIVAVGLSDDPNGGTDADYTVWDTYGWDGSNWVVGNPNSKLTHAGSELLVDGVNISFDDNGGTQTFTSGEYFTFGLVDGVWQDGGTEWEHQSRLYFKPGRDKVTDFTPGTVPGSAALPSEAVEIEFTSVANGTAGPGLIGSWELQSGTLTEINGAAVYSNTTSGNQGGRVNVVSAGDTYVRFKGSLRFSSVVSPNPSLLGLVPNSLLGTSHQDPATNTGALYAFVLNGGSIIIRESGSDVLTVATGVTNLALVNSYFEIERIGTTVNYYWNGDLVRTTTGIGGSLVPEVTIGNGASPSFRWQVEDYRVTTNDYWVQCGAPGPQTGVYDPDFQLIDHNFGVRVLLDGTPATLVRDDTLTVLSAGEVGVYRSGHLRFAAADAGRAVTGRYTYLTSS